MAEMRACPTCPNRRIADEADARAAAFRGEADSLSARASLTDAEAAALSDRASQLKVEAEALANLADGAAASWALRSLAPAWRQEAEARAGRADAEGRRAWVMGQRARSEVDGAEALRRLAIAEESRAEEIRAAGCQWLWNVWVEGKDGQPEPRTECGSTHIVTALNKLGGEVVLASETIQEDRNEQAKAIDKIEAAIAERGGGEVLRALGRIGLLTVQSGLQKEGRPGELPEAAGETE